MHRPPSIERRSARAHQAVLGAALALLRETGYRQMTVDAIAVRSGVSKATIYRWWPHKAAILMEAFLTSVETDIAFPDSGSLREDLVTQMSALIRVLRDPYLGALIVALLGEAQHDTQLAAAFRDGWQLPRRSAGRGALARARERGEISSDTDLELVLDGVYGPLYLRLLFGHAPLDDASLNQLVDQVLDGLTPRGPASSQPPAQSRLCETESS